MQRNGDRLLRLHALVNNGYLESAVMYYTDGKVRFGVVGGRRRMRTELTGPQADALVLGVTLAEVQLLDDPARETTFPTPRAVRS